MEEKGDERERERETKTHKNNEPNDIHTYTFLRASKHISNVLLCSLWTGRNVFHVFNA